MSKLHKDLATALQCPPVRMSETIRKFSKGVHSPENCGKNRFGYAALEASLEYTDPHILQDKSFMASAPSDSVPKKITFMSIESFAYMFLRMISLSPNSNVYILLLSRGMIIRGIIKSIVDAMTSTGIMVIIVGSIENRFDVAVRYSDWTCKHKFDSTGSFHDFFSKSDLGSDISFVAYPVLTADYIRLMESMSNSSWCIPAYCNELYVCDGKTDFCSHNAYPWSSKHFYSGFTIGKGQIRIATSKEQQRYIAAYNLYHSMISSVPIGRSCIDCISIGYAAKMLSVLIGEPIDVPIKHRLSNPSIEALEELNKRIDNAKETS